MNAIKLEDIEARQNELAQMIAAFKAANQEHDIIIPHQTIHLDAGEKYAGMLRDNESDAHYHVILLLGQADDVNWEEAWKWAQAKNGNLPTRKEQALLFANLAHEFEERWYWSCEQHAANSGSAWCQDFNDGGQSYLRKDDELRARAVRRVPQ